MKKSYSSKAFTLIELMVSIFITITIIASFYKLYNASVKTERSSSIRVAVNLMGEQMIDTIAESVRLIGLNSTKLYFDGAEGALPNIIIKATENEFEFLSPFGSPITKVKEAEGDFPNCTFTLFNSAAFHSGVTKLYFHNQDGFFKTTNMAVSSFSGDDVTVVTSAFEENCTGTEKECKCKNMFPNGSLVTGEDFRYTLKYTATTEDDSELKLSCKREVGGVWTSDDNCTLIDFKYDPEDSGMVNFYSMPKFILEYLVEDCVKEPSGSLTCTTKWESSDLDVAKIKEIIAVRFGFVLLSRKERIYAGSDTSGTIAKYCIFEDKQFGVSGYYCYELKNLNYTASVFRRIVYLSNYRFFIDESR